ncbi:hypothetical protein H3Z83_09245 [Tenacibaculum sp. S7007]|uniref:Uncharacterized protein n=1 Tax=Tenacibaculum pelagium TaxID=2759527 RepID=A0A839AQ41_9FLAO|nr:hypothetical protein [Tenacibaculum pelagium]MBA6156697.1 hypothetical protein [Tenacibaculum pelagium]
MMLSIIGFFVGLYVYARRVVKNDIIKRKIDRVINGTNKALRLYKETKPKTTLKTLNKLSIKGILFSLILSTISLIFTFEIKNELLKFITPIFILSALLAFSISWIQKHKETRKNLFLNINMLSLLFAPSIVYYIGGYIPILNIDINRIFKPLNYLMEDVGVFNFQLIWILMLLVVFYIGAFVVAIPIYTVIYMLILVTALFIKLIEKYIDNNILDAIFGTLTLGILLYKIFL